MRALEIRTSSPGRAPAAQRRSRAQRPVLVAHPLNLHHRLVPRVVRRQRDLHADGVALHGRGPEHFALRAVQLGEVVPAHGADDRGRRPLEEPDLGAGRQVRADGQTHPHGLRRCHGHGGADAAVVRVRHPVQARRQVAKVFRRRHPVEADAQRPDTRILLHRRALLLVRRGQRHGNCRIHGVEPRQMRPRRDRDRLRAFRRGLAPDRHPFVRPRLPRDDRKRQTEHRPHGDTEHPCSHHRDTAERCNLPPVVPDIAHCGGRRPLAGGMPDHRTGLARCHRRSTSKAAMLRVSLLNSTPIRWMGAPVPRYFPA